MAEKETYREVMPGEITCEDHECDGVIVDEPDDSHKMNRNKCGHMK